MTTRPPSRILVVDDDAAACGALVDLLSFHGLPAQGAESGERALEALDREPFDLVLLDVRLPGLDGFETCARIRERHGVALPVILMTGYPAPNLLSRCQEAGADDFLLKPVETATLILKARSFLRFKSLHDEILRNREQAQTFARDLALLHEIGRDWSLIAEPEQFRGTVTERLAGLIGAPVCVIFLYDPATRTLSAALPAQGLSDDVARRVACVVKPEDRSLSGFRSGRAYLSSRALPDSRLVQELVQAMDAESMLLVPMLSEGEVLGLLVAADKPGGFTESDVQLLSIFAGPMATFLRSRQIFRDQRQHASRLERLSALVGDMAGTSGRAALLAATIPRIQKDLGYERVAFYAYDGGDALRLEVESGAERPPDLPLDAELLRWAGRGTTALPGTTSGAASELAVPVRAGDRALGVLNVLRQPGTAFADEELNLLTAVAGHLAVALQKAAGREEAERLARQMATLYDLALETSGLRDLQLLFAKATEEAGRLIKADHTSVFRLAEAEGTLSLFAAWARDPARETYAAPVFRVGEGVAGRVVQDRLPVLVNECEQDAAFVVRANPVSRLLCVPLVYYDQERKAPAIFGVLNATRRPGAPPFIEDDLDYLTRFAGQLSIAAANSMAFQAERERSEQLVLVNALIREIAGNLSRKRILQAAVRRIHEAFRYPVVMIAEPDPQSGLNRIEAAVGPESGPQLPSSFPLSAGVVARAVREKRTVLAPDVSQEPDCLPMVAATRSQVAVPIVSGADVVAVLNVESDAVGAFSRGEVITLETLADGIGIILRNAELFRALEQTNTKLVELDRTRSELVNIVAHDFRAPLAGVLGYAELLEWRPDAPRAERVEHARAIIQSATHMASLVDKTLKTTRLETGHFPFEFDLVDIGAHLRELVRRLPEDKRHPLTASIPEDPLPCWADGERITEVVENLLANAVKYSPGGGPIRLEVKAESELVSVKVEDRGIGIAAKDLERLFHPFSRIRDKKTEDIDGSGLGLYICDRIVRAHGGRISVESQPGVGSCFSLSLPLFGAAAQSRAPLVLVAASDEGTRREVRRVVEELGCGVHEVGDGVEAVEAAVRLLPAAVVLDRVLPRLRAEEVAERLKENEATASVPLFALTADGELGSPAGLFEACIPKPLDRSLLMTMLEGCLRGERRLTSPPSGA